MPGRVGQDNKWVVIVGASVVEQRRTQLERSRHLNSLVLAIDHSEIEVYLLVVRTIRPVRLRENGDLLHGECWGAVEVVNHDEARACRRRLIRPVFKAKERLPEHCEARCVLCVESRRYQLRK